MNEQSLARSFVLKEIYRETKKRVDDDDQYTSDKQKRKAVLSSSSSSSFQRRYTALHMYLYIHTIDLF
jgi:hypothetical protein